MSNENLTDREKYNSAERHLKIARDLLKTDDPEMGIFFDALRYRTHALISNMKNIKGRLPWVK